MTRDSASSPAAQAVAPVSTPLVVRGLVLDSLRRPARGARVEIGRWTPRDGVPAVPGQELTALVDAHPIARRQDAYAHATATPPRDFEKLGEALAGADGEFVLEDARLDVADAPSLRLYAWLAEGAAEHTSTGVPPSGSVGELVLEVACALSLRVECSGLPVAGARVELRQYQLELDRRGIELLVLPHDQWIVESRRNLEPPPADQPRLVAIRVTDAQGAIHDGLPRIDFFSWVEVIVSAPGYARAFAMIGTEDLTLPAESSRTISLVRAAPVTGRVVGPDGCGLAGAEVRGFDESGRHVETRRTDDAGRFALAELAPGQHRLRVRPQAADLVETALAFEAPGHVEVSLAACATLEVQVTPAPGLAVEATSLVLLLEPEHEAGLATLLATCHAKSLADVPPARIPDLAPGRYSAILRGRGLAPARVPVELAGGRTARIEVAARAERRVALRVLGPGHEPLQATIATSSRNEASGEDGRATIGELPWEETRLVVSAQGYSPQAVSVPAGVTAIPDVLLAKQPK